jgi:RimJ/RimL family protein N-acetyltransferase
MSSSYFWEGRLVRLRAMNEDDTRIWLENQFESEIDRTLNPGIELPKTESDRADFYARFGEFRDAEGRIMFTIETLDGTVVGGLNINGIDRRHGTFNIGSRIYTKYQGNGYFAEAKRIVLRYCFNELRLHKYNASVLETNEAMLRHFKRIGAKPEGRRREVVFTNGQYYGELLFGLTAEEFAENDSDWQKG